MHSSSGAHPKFTAPATPPPVGHGHSPGGARRRERAHFLGSVVDPSTGELWPGGGEARRLRPQLSSLLELLVRRPGELVKRSEIQEHLWADRALDVDRSINFCVRQLRAALDDDAKEPRFIETLPRQGYRFIAAVRWISKKGEPADTRKTLDERPSPGSSGEETAPGPAVTAGGEGPSRVAEPPSARDAAGHGQPAEGKVRARRRRFADGATGAVPGLVALIAAIMAGVVIVGAAFVLLVDGSGARGPETAPDASTSGPPAAHPAGAVTPPSPLEVELRLGDLQMLEGRYGTAAATFQAVVARHPQSARAWTRLSEAHVQLARDRPEAFDDADFALSRAEVLAPESSAVSMRRGDLLALRDRRWPEALLAFESATVKDPGLIEAHISLAFASAMLDQFRRSAEHLEKALELDPLNRRTLIEAAMLRAAARDWTASRALSLRLLELEHRSTVALSRLIEANRRLGLEAEAREAARRLAQVIELDDGELSFSTEDDYRRLWLRLIDRQFDGPGHRKRAQRAVYLARMGDRDGALALLETVAAGRSWLLPLALLEPELEALREDPRFTALKLEANRPWRGDGP
ncbi:MAG: winged helix-turn-helix domain-containing protein [Acidobacteriota bacterium]